MIPRPRASDAYRIWMCPPSHRAEHTLVEFGLLPPQEPNIHALSSTRQHVKLSGKDIELAEPEKQAVTESQAEVEAFLSRENLEHAYLDQTELALETDWWTGHIDRAIVNAGEKTGAVIDYKQIKWGDHAHAADNPQLWVYVHLLSSHHRSMEQCWAVLQQPGHEQTSTLFDPKALKGLHDWAIATSQKTLDPAAKFTAGDWCEHCRLKAICPEGRQYLAKTQMLAEDEELPVGNPVILGMLLDRFRVLSWFEDAIKNLSKILLRQDKNAVQGWKLTSGRQKTIIKDLGAAYKVSEALGIPLQAWHEPVPRKLKEELEQYGSASDIEALIEVVIEPGYMVRMTSKERKQLGFE